MSSTEINTLNMAFGRD